MLKSKLESCGFNLHELNSQGTSGMAVTIRLPIRMHQMTLTQTSQVHHKAVGLQVNLRATQSFQVTLMFATNIGQQLFSLSVTWQIVSVAASRLQGLGTSFKAFTRLKSNAATTLSFQQKSIPEMLHKMHQQAQPDKGVTNQTPFPNTAYSSFPCVVVKIGNYPSSW